MRVDFVTLFPELCEKYLQTSILGRAARCGLYRAYFHQIRDYTKNKQRQTDDYPYGGGPGMVLYAQPIADCLRAVQRACAEEGAAKPHIVFMSASGRPLTEQEARRLAQYECLTLVCGHYEGIDERVIDAFADEVLSIGDYVLTGGELAALVVADSVLRLQPGVLAEPRGFEEESYWDDLLEYPQYTRPEVWEGRRVPPVLLSGDHKKIAQWRLRASRERTKALRPDLYEHWAANHPVTDVARWKRSERMELVRTQAQRDALLALCGEKQAECRADEPANCTFYLHSTHGSADGFVGFSSEVGQIGALYVALDRREQGIGTKMLDFACKKIEREGKVPTICMEKDNLAAKRLLIRMGFAPADVADPDKRLYKRVKSVALQPPDRAAP